MKDLSNARKYFIIVLLITCCISIAFAFATRNINFWPTDSYYFYIPTAAKVWQLPYISKMHDIFPEESLGSLNMHGKEMLILGIAVMQKFLGDNQTLYPNVLLLILCIQISAITTYLIIKKIFGPSIGLLGFVLFSFCFWPYMYALQGAHQPMVLMFFLLSALFILNIKKYKIYAFLAGSCVGFMFFSSPTAVVYLPYFLFAFFLADIKKTTMQKSFSNTVAPLMLFTAGLLAVLLLLTYPDPVKVLKDFIVFLFYSRHQNHFDLYHAQLISHIPQLEANTFRGAGWLWIIKYMFFIQPILMFGYICSLCYLLKRSFSDRKMIFIILLSLSTPLAAEISGVAQFGRNYFSWMPGIILVICYTTYLLTYKRQLFRMKKYYVYLGLLLCVLFIFSNAYIFLKNIFPARMELTYLKEWLAEKKVEKLFVHSRHPRKNYVAKSLWPQLGRHTKLITIDSISQVSGGYVLLPPSSGMTIWDNCAGRDFIKEDVGKYAVAEFKTISSSRYWMQEEEVCTYRDLMLGQVNYGDQGTLDPTKVYILDVKK